MVDMNSASEVEFNIISDPKRDASDGNFQVFMSEPHFARWLPLSDTMSVARHSVAVYDDKPTDDFFEREKARLVEEISSVCLGYDPTTSHFDH